MQEKKKIKRIKIKESSAGGPYFDGNPTFRGGPYGVGNKNQLAAPLNPATRAIEDQEQSEVNQNVEDQQRSLGKYPRIRGKLPQDINSNTKHNSVLETAQGDQWVSRHPGWPRENALEEPRIHLPIENFVIDKPKSGGTDGTEDYLVDDIIDELDTDWVIENALNQEALVPPHHSPSAIRGNRGGLSKSHIPALKKTTPGQIGHAGEDVADTSPLGGVGTVMFPKKFVPDDQPTQQSNMPDSDLDGISDTIDLDQKSDLRKTIAKEEFRLNVLKQIIQEEIRAIKHNDK